MQVTNEYNLPDAIVRSVSNFRPLVKDRFSVTDLIGPPLMRQLKIKHWDEITEDASDKLWMLLGSAVHYILEKSSPENALEEEKLEVPFMGVTIVGKVDLWHGGEISDWKITSVYSFLLGDKPEWEAQLNLYSYLYSAHGFQTERLRIYAILRDWQKSKALASADYPQIPFMSVDVRLWNQEELMNYIGQRIHLHQTEGRECTDEERWARPTTYAVKKEGRKTAVRVFDTRGEAETLALTDPKHFVEERKGEYIRCKSFCPVRNFCKFNPYREA